MAFSTATPGSNPAVTVDVVSSGDTQVIKIDGGVSGSSTPIVAGQNTMANSLPVVLASNQTNVPTLPSDAVLISSASQTALGNLFSQDVTGYNSVSVQVTSAGTATISYEVSNDNTTWYAIQGYNTTNAGTSGSLSTSAAALTATFPCPCRYFRARVSAYTSGTVTVVAYMRAAPFPVVFSGLVTVNSGTQLIGDVSLQSRANNSGTASKSHLVSAATTNATIIKASAGKVLSARVSNTNAAWRYVKLHNIATTPTAGSGVVETIGVPPGATVSWELLYGSGFSTGIGMTMVTGSADSDATAVAVGDLIADIFYS
jgi:hypothetical protein